MAGERTTRPTGAPGGGRSAPLPFAVSSQWIHTPHLTRPHLIPEPGQIALLLAQSPPREGGRGVTLGHPEPPTMFPEALISHPLTMFLVRGHQSLPPRSQKERVLPS